MENRVYATPKRERYITLLILFIAILFYLAYIIWKDNWYGLINLTPALFAFWYTFQKYTLTPQGLIIERGIVFYYRINRLDWDTITHVEIVGRKVRIDYARSNGCKGFYMTQVDDYESFYKDVKSHLSNIPSAETA